MTLHFWHQNILFDHSVIPVIIFIDKVGHFVMQPICFLYIMTEAQTSIYLVNCCNILHPRADARLSGRKVVACIRSMTLRLARSAREILQILINNFLFGFLSYIFSYVRRCSQLFAYYLNFFSMFSKMILLEIC